MMVNTTKVLHKINMLASQVAHGGLGGMLSLAFLVFLKSCILKNVYRLRPIRPYTDVIYLWFEMFSNGCHIDLYKSIYFCFVYIHVFII